LVKSAHAFDGAHVECILTAQIPWVLRFDFSVDDIVFLLLFQGSNLRFGERITGLRHMPL